jgi:ApbE superfamily uncharacterized protein (UPF0280 family)
MANAATRAGVGPMAAVAGAISEDVARDLATVSPEVLVENGGDLFCIVRTRSRTSGIGQERPYREFADSGRSVAIEADESCLAQVVAPRQQTNVVQFTAN